MASMDLINLTSSGLLPFLLLLHPLLLLRVHLLQPMVPLLLLLLPVLVLLLLIGMHLQRLLSLLELPLIGARSRILLSRASRPSSPCAALIRESHQQMSQWLSHLEERQHEISSSVGFAVPEPIIYPHPPPVVEDPWAWYRNADNDGENGDEDDDEYEI
jgi:hypothetical protein